MIQKALQIKQKIHMKIKQKKDTKKYAFGFVFDPTASTADPAVFADAAPGDPAMGTDRSHKSFTGKATKTTSLKGPLLPRPDLSPSGSGPRPGVDRYTLTHMYIYIFVYIYIYT